MKPEIPTDFTAQANQTLALINQVNAWEAMLEHAERIGDSGMAYSCRNALEKARRCVASHETVISTLRLIASHDSGAWAAGKHNKDAYEAAFNHVQSIAASALRS